MTGLGVDHGACPNDCGAHCAPRPTPVVVTAGWIAADHLDSERALLTYADGTVRFRHRCDRGLRGVIICAPALQIGNGHTLTRNAEGKPTVRASVACGDCAEHGFVTDGRWEAC